MVCIGISEKKWILKGLYGVLSHQHFLISIEFEFVRERKNGVLFFLDVVKLEIHPLKHTPQNVACLVVENVEQALLIFRYEMKDNKAWCTNSCLQLWILTLFRDMGD